MELEDRWGLPAWWIEENWTVGEIQERCVYDSRIRISEIDLQTANICYTLACCLTEAKGRKFVFEDFLPARVKARKRPAKTTEIRDFDLMAAALGVKHQGG